MASSMSIWSPRGPALGVYVTKADWELDWDQFRNRLKKRIRDLADGDPHPEATLENEWNSILGGTLYLSNLESAIDNPEFLEILADRHNLGPSNFPMEVGPQLEDEGWPTNLTEWVQSLKY